MCARVRARAPSLSRPSPPPKICDDACAHNRPRFPYARRRSPWLAAALAVVALAGCGSSSLDSASHAAPPAPPATRPAQSAASAPRMASTDPGSTRALGSHLVRCPGPGARDRARGPRSAARQGPGTAYRLPARALRPGVVRRRPQRLRHPQRRAAPRPHGIRPEGGDARVPGAPGDAARSLHEHHHRVPARAEHVQPRADRPRRRPLRRLAEGGPAAVLRGRTAFANDPLNLLAVDGPTNQRKGDGDAATWLPPQRAYRCAYVARQVAVKQRYRLWVTAAEREAITRVLRSCPGQALPVARPIPLGGGRVESAPAPAPTASAPLALAAPPRQGATDPRFDTCRAAKAAGYGPTPRGRTRSTSGTRTATTTAWSASSQPWAGRKSGLLRSEAPDFGGFDGDPRYQFGERGLSITLRRSTVRGRSVRLSRAPVQGGCRAVSAGLRVPPVRAQLGRLG